MRLMRSLGVLGVVVGASMLVTGCNSSSDCSDGGDCTADGPVAGNDTGTAADSGGADSGLFGITPGDYCYDVLAIAAGASDVCDIGAADFVGMALPGHYDKDSGMFTLGTDGALGTGVISNNMGTLHRENMPTVMTMPSCSFHQTDTTMLVLTDVNQFTASVTEVEDMFAAAPACSMIPTGGSCTSTWTWSLKISATKTPPGCD